MHIQVDNEVALTAKMTWLGYPVSYQRKVVGPIVTTYYFNPESQAPISKILNRGEDLAMACSVEAIIIKRVLHQIVVEVPNAKREIVRFDKCLHWLSTDVDARFMALPLLMGVGTNGTEYAIDLAAQPHVLIAGSTGAGKSVFLAELISSLAVLRSPQQLELYLVDTKQLDLTLFSKLPHVKETIDNITQLHKTLHEIEVSIRRRMELMRGYARNISEYNFYCHQNHKHGAELPYIVMVIDELADIIDQDRALAQTEDKDGKRVRIEQKIKTITQISRAAGIHIIAATQRPSVKIINGDIKANFPTRISFKLPSGTDSRVVLGETGAECLLGRGDYLVQQASSDTTTRGHGAFVTMEDIKMVVEQSEYIRQSMAAATR